MDSNKGFTLIELMIVVVIIGLLPTIALPNFVRFQGGPWRPETSGTVSVIDIKGDAISGDSDPCGPAGGEPGKLGRSECETAKVLHSSS